MATNTEKPHFYYTADPSKCQICKGSMYEIKLTLLCETITYFRFMGTRDWGQLHFFYLKLWHLAVWTPLIRKIYSAATLLKYFMWIQINPILFHILRLINKKRDWPKIWLHIKKICNIWAIIMKLSQNDYLMCLLFWPCLWWYLKNYRFLLSFKLWTSPVFY